MLGRHARLTVIIFVSLACSSPFGTAQPLVPSMVCKPNDFWADCASKVKTTIRKTQDPAVALSAGAEWADRYMLLYKANARDTWPFDDQKMLEEAMTKLWDESVGKYLDPATLAFGLALAKYFPRLAAAVELAGGPQVTAFVILLAPSPISNDFTAARSDNMAINKLVMERLPLPGAMTIRQRYPELFERSYTKVKGKKIRLP